MSSASPDVLLENVTVVAPRRMIDRGWLLIREGRIAAAGGEADGVPATGVSALKVDGDGAYALPGFIDVHVHGGAGHDFLDAGNEELEAITRFHAGHGTTAMLATSLTASRERLTGMLERVAAFRRGEMPYARLLGVHLEGPFISVKWGGAQNPAHIVPPNEEWLLDWHRRFPGLIRLMTLAPETPGALSCIERLNACGIVPACGHTDATFDEIRAAVGRGLRHAVHTFNAMRPLHHREPGTVGAVLTEPRIMAEIIADGHHVHPAAIRLLLQAKGVDSVILVTDAMAASGMPDGAYELGGLPVTVKDGQARLTNTGNLAGSTLTMIEAFRYMIRHAGATVAEASRMASANPARQLGISEECGSLEPGKRADIVLVDRNLALRGVWIGGRRIR